MKRYVLPAVLLASQVFAQAPVPTGLMPELSVPKAQAREVGFHGVSAITNRGDRFTIVTTNEPFWQPLHGLMEVDAEGVPQLQSTQLIGGCGNGTGVASDGQAALAVWGCLGGTTGLLWMPDGTGRSIAIHDRTRYPFGRRDFSGIRDVAWDGGQYVVLSALQIPNDSANPSFYTDRPIATRIAADGTILQNDIDLGSGDAYAIASRSGVSVMLIRADGLIARTMNASGVISPSQLLVSGAVVPALAAGANGFLVAWGNANGLYVQHLNVDGIAEGSPLLLHSAPAQSVAVTAEGADYRVAWSSEQVIRATRIRPGGIADPRVVVGPGSSPALAWNGAVTMLVWDAPDGIRARPIDETGSGSLVHALADQQSLVSAAMTGSGLAVAWRERSFVDGQSVSSHLQDGRGHVAIEHETITHLRGLHRALIIEGSQPPFVVRYVDAPDETFEVPSRRLFWVRDGFLAVWSNPVNEAEPSAPGPLFAQRFSASGTPLDASPRTLGWTFPRDAAYTGPAAAYNGIAVAASADEILLTYVDPWATVQGVILRGDETIAIGEIATPQALANPIEITSDGTDFLVTWISNKETVHSYIGSRRVLAGGAMPDEMRVQSGAGDMKEQMATFWTGEHYLVVWSSVNTVGEPRTISGIRISRDGTLMDYPERVIGTLDGYAPQFAYRNGLLAMAYERDGRVWWRYAGSPRRRAVAR